MRSRSGSRAGPSFWKILLGYFLIYIWFLKINVLITDASQWDSFANVTSLITSGTPEPSSPMNNHQENSHTEHRGSDPTAWAPCRSVINQTDMWRDKTFRKVSTDACF